MDWQISPGAALIGLQATMAWADAGWSSSRLQIFTSAQPHLVMRPEQLRKAEFALAKPLQRHYGRVWSLIAAEPGDTMVLVNSIHAGAAGLPLPVPGWPTAT